MNDEYKIVGKLQDFIRINTTNPPGNEEAAAQFLEALLVKEGISCRLYKPAKGRANLLARVKGKTRGKPLILLAHIDVVAAHAEEWDHEPFGAEIDGDYLYGRGTIDMKTQAICQLMACVRYCREGLVPERDIIYLATCDEEVGGQFGVEYMLKNVLELQEASFVLSEGGCIVDDDGFVHAQIAVTEKRLAQFMIKAAGTSGHGSMPHRDNANVKIINASKRIIDYEWPLKITPVASAYLEGIIAGKTAGKRSKANLKELLGRKRTREEILDNPVRNALLRNTVTPTVLKAGEKINVIPSESTACFDARLLPTEDHGRFVERIKKLAGKEVEVSQISSGAADLTPANFRTPWFKALCDVVALLKGNNVPVLPYMMTGATDLRHFRNLGIPAYGFFPITIAKDELLRMHGRNERILVKNVHEGFQGTYEILKSLA